MRIEVRLPGDMDSDARGRLLEREREHGFELKRRGTILRIWRIPGRLANVGIWDAEDATVLHDAIASLPVFPWIDADVVPLAMHHLEAGD